MPIRTFFLLLIGFGFLYGLFTVGLPFLLALVSAVFLEPVIRFLMRTARVNRLTAATAVCSVFTVLLIGLCYLIGVKLVTELIAFWKHLPLYVNEMHRLFLAGIEKSRLLSESLSPETAEQFEKSLAAGVDALAGALQSLLSSVSGSFFNLAKMIPGLFVFFVVFVVAVYLFSYSLAHIKASFLSLFEEKSRPKVESVLSSLHSAVFGFIRAQLIISVLIYIVTAAGLFLLRANYPLAMALVVVLVDILPVLGTGSVLVPWAVYRFVTGDSFTGVGLLLLFLFITIFRRIVEPKIIGDSVGIGALSALISLYVGFQLAGLIGLIMGPIVVIIYQAMVKAGLLKIRIRLE